MGTIEEFLEEGEVTRSEPIPAPVTTEIFSLTSFQGQEESTDSKDMQPSFPVEIMPFMGMLK